MIRVEEVGQAVDAGVVEGLGLDGEEAGGGEGGVFFGHQPADGIEEIRGAVEDIAKVPAAAGDAWEIGDQRGGGGAEADGAGGLDDLLEDVDLDEFLPGELLAQPAGDAVVDVGEGTLAEKEDAGAPRMIIHGYRTITPLDGCPLEVGNFLFDGEVRCGDTEGIGWG